MSDEIKKVDGVGKRKLGIDSIRPIPRMIPSSIKVA